MTYIKKRIPKLQIIFLLFLLQSCSEVRLVSEVTKEIIKPQVEVNNTKSFYGYYKVGKPYEIAGKWYYPKEEPEETFQRGIASWYGPGFHGKKTANGATFDMNKVSAAHTTLPLPSIVHVKNLENGKKLKVLVNDRGPYKHGRVIDLSKKAADLLGFKKKGIALVEIEYLYQDTVNLWRTIGNNPYADGQPSAAPNIKISSNNLPSIGKSIDKNVSASQENVTLIAQANAQELPTQSEEETEKTRWKVTPEFLEQSLEDTPVRSRPKLFIQVGAFAEYANAVRVRALLSSIGKVLITQVNVVDQPLFRVRLGPVRSVSEAEYFLQTIHENGFPEARIVVLEE